MGEKTRTEIVGDVRVQLAEYVQFRERHGSQVTFRQALLDHRRQVQECLRDDPHGPWRERLSWLDQICAEEGIKP